MILVIGGTGNIGRELINRLFMDGVEARALVRDPLSAEARRIALRTVELVKGDLADRDSLDAALRGVDKAFLLSAASPRSAALQNNFVDAANSADLDLLVKSSALGAGPDTPVSLLRWHWETEKHLIDSGVPYTILRPNAFYQNLLQVAPLVKAQGIIAYPQKDGRVSQVDTRDVAAVAAAVLTGTIEDYAGKTYDITGPEALSNDEVARKLSAAIGKMVRYVDTAPEDFKKTLLGTGAPEWSAQGLTELEVFYAGGGAAEVTGVVAAVAGKAPRTLDHFIQENVAAFTD